MTPKVKVLQPSKSTTGKKRKKGLDEDVIILLSGSDDTTILPRRAKNIRVTKTVTYTEDIEDSY